MNDGQVGWIKGRTVLCDGCLDRCNGHATLPKPIALYSENVSPYKQSCHACDTIIQKPRTESWPELFSKGM